MSEIFSWLKRNEAAKSRTVDADVGIMRVAVPELPDAPEPRPVEAPAVVPARKIELVESARFSLAAATHNLRAVLDPLTVAGEQYRLLRSKLSQMQKDRGIKTLLVTSSIQYEGKTFTACSLAGIIAQDHGKRVLLIDGDLRRPRVSRELGMHDTGFERGLSQVLRGESGTEYPLMKAAEGELYVLPSGPVPEDPSELLSSVYLERALKAFAHDFDWIVIDSPPVISMADATIMAPLCDAVLLVVRAEKTPSKMIKQTIQQIGQNRICGIVLNRARNLRQSRYYYEYYRKSAKVV